MKAASNEKKRLAAIAAARERADEFEMAIIKARCLWTPIPKSKAGGRAVGRSPAPKRRAKRARWMMMVLVKRK